MGAGEPEAEEPREGGGEPSADAAPSLQLWDIGGQPRFRSMWERYCRGVSAIV